MILNRKNKQMQTFLGIHYLGTVLYSRTRLKRPLLLPEKIGSFTRGCLNMVKIVHGNFKERWWVMNYRSSLIVGVSQDRLYCTIYNKRHIYISMSFIVGIYCNLHVVLITDVIVHVSSGETNVVAFWFQNKQPLYFVHGGLVSSLK